MSTRFNLFWLTESGCDWDRGVEAESLDPAIRDRVMALAGHDGGPLALRLPFFDRRESRRRAEILRGLRLVREGDVIRSLPATPLAGLRDHAATLLATHPAWTGAPDERQPSYFPAWQNVSIALQNALRQWIPELYFREAARYEDREAVYPLLVYEASRICRGRPRTEFTYDIADPEMLPCALKLIGRTLQGVLARVESALHAAGRLELARRYGPIWHEDVLRAVQKKPRHLIALLGDEAALINAVIDLGTARRMEAVKPFARSAHLALRHVAGVDMRPLAARALDAATQALEEQPRRTT